MPAFRLNTDEFPVRVRTSFLPEKGLTLTVDGKTLQGSFVRSVWYRRHVEPALPPGLDEGVRDFCEREARAFLDGALGCLPAQRWMSHPAAVAQAERKPYQLAIASELGFRIPRTLITNDSQMLTTIAAERELVAKAVSSGYVASERGNRAIFTSALSTEDLEKLNGLELSPVIFQERIPKLADIRVTVVASKVFAAEILSQEDESSAVDWRATTDPELPHRVHTLPEEIAGLCRRLVSHLGLAFGAIDLALQPDGQYVFFEINPNGEWLWLEDKLGFPIADTIAEWLSRKSQ